MDLHFMLGVCLLTLIVDMLFFGLFPVPNYYFEPVKITALGVKNNLAKSNEVPLKYVSVYKVQTTFPEIETGKWFWKDGIYLWRSESDDRRPWDLTDSVVLKVPVGKERALIFGGCKWNGYATVSIGDYSENIDLYSEEAKDISVMFPDSSRELIFKNELHRVLFFLIIHSTIFIFSVLIAAIWKKLNVISLFCQYRYEFVFFIFSLFMLIKNSWYPSIYAYSTSFYMNGYEFGFIKRGLTGEIFTNISPFLSKEELSTFKLCFLISLYFILSILIGRIVRKQADNKISWFFTMLILSLPSTFIFITDDMRPDVYIGILFITSAFLIAEDYALWLIPILTTTMLFTNETSCTYYLVPILAMLLYKFVKSQRIKYCLVIAGCLCFAVPLCLSLLLRNDPRLLYDIEKVINHIQYHAEFSVNHTALDAETWTLSQMFHDLSNKLANSYYYRGSMFFFLSLLPMGILFGYIWRVLYRKIADRDVRVTCRQRSLFFILALSPLVAFAPIMVALDFSRYSAFMINAVLATMFFFIQEEQVQLQYDDLRIGGQDASTVNIIPIVICTFYFIFGMYTSTGASTATSKKFSTFFTLLLRL